jgi:hypothetical protein
VSDKVYSRNEENYYELGDLIDMLESDGELVPGTVIYEGEQVQRTASFFMHGVVDSIAEGLADQAWEEAGEFAEDWPELPLDKKLELGELIGKWLDANVPVTFWTVKNARQIELTEEWIAENTATVPSGVTGPAPRRPAHLMELARVFVNPADAGPFPAGVALPLKGEPE